MVTRTLLGLSLAAVVIGAPPAYPLHGHDGVPACGNVGQRGRPVKTLAAPVVRPVPAASTRPAVQPKTVLAPAALSRQPAARPRRAPDGDPACGNVQGKGRRS